MIELMKASAGSGKTWNLARTYIRLLLEHKDDRRHYRHILAVTFTNKATEEMKSRILKELNILASDPQKSDYHNDFVPSLVGDDQEMKKLARRILCDILHDYSAFSVSTIDRFFQQTLKAFAREIGQFASYKVELDRNSLVDESVDRVLDSLSENDESGTLAWLVETAFSQLDSGKKFSIEEPLRDAAKRLNSAEHSTAAAAAGLDVDKLYSPETVAALKKGCAELRARFLSEAKALSDEVYKAFAADGVDQSLMKVALKKALAKYGDPNTDPTKKLKSFTQSEMDIFEDVSKWFVKSKSHPENAVSPASRAAVEAYRKYAVENLPAYNTVPLLEKQIYGFGVANELYRSFKELLKEKNVMGLDDSNEILRGIIDRSNVPFIYEKTGTRYENFLLDEFQDTSRVQWENFCPLIEESVGYGRSNLVVGDVKQSIYRWRSSDWKLLSDEIPQHFEGKVDDHPLEVNFRSWENIVKFNNDFFRDAASKLDSLFGSGNAIAGIYKEVAQTCPDKHKGGGGAFVSVCDKENELEKILQLVKDAHDNRGFAYGDIAILVRKNMAGARVADYLVRNGIDVMTSDSITVDSALTVKRLIALLHHIDNPEDTVSSYLAKEEFKLKIPTVWHSLTDLCEMLIRSLKEVDSECFESEVIYVHCFMDMLQDYVAKYGNTLHDFLEKLKDPKFMRYVNSPSEQDSVTIMTIHKSKGLDFPMVIVPCLDETEFYNSRMSKKWCAPDVKGTMLEDFAGGIYDVGLSESGSCDTVFYKNYREEAFMQYVDNLNLLYVAFTRPVDCLHVLAPHKNFEEFRDNPHLGPARISTLADLIHWYLAQNNLPLCAQDELSMSFGTGEVVRHIKKDSDSRPVVEIASGYPSWELNPNEENGEEDVREKGRLKFSSDSVDFFSEDGVYGMDASRRIRGIVMHDILSRVIVPSDLEAAVDKACVRGELPDSERDETLAMLGDAIARMAKRGWFPEDGSKVYAETSLLDTDGEIYRPDRVVDDGENVIVVDYKFGEHRRKYERQVKGYADIYRRMGRRNVSAFLWYVDTDTVREY